MIRSYVVTFAIGMWASWTGPLLATEAILQGRKILMVNSVRRN